MDGKLQADPKKFPSGLKALSDRLAGMGEALCQNRECPTPQQCIVQHFELVGVYSQASKQEDLWPMDRCSQGRDALACSTSNPRSIA